MLEVTKLLGLVQICYSRNLATLADGGKKRIATAVMLIRVVCDISTAAVIILRTERKPIGIVPAALYFKVSYVAYATQILICTCLAFVCMVKASSVAVRYKVQVDFVNNRIQTMS